MSPIHVLVCKPVRANEPSREGVLVGQRCSVCRTPILVSPPQFHVWLQSPTSYFICVDCSQKFREYLDKHAIRVNPDDPMMKDLINGLKRIMKAREN